MRTLFWWLRLQIIRLRARRYTEAEKARIRLRAKGRFFLSLPRDTWRGARIVFRRVHTGMSPGQAIIGFTADTGVTDPALLAELETVLRDLAAEKRR